MKQKGSVQMPHLGRVDVEARVRPHALPYLTFHDEAGKHLLTVPLGGEDPDIFRVTPEEDAGSRENPIVRFFVVSGPAGASSVVLAMAEYQGGSDCEYVASVIGEHGGAVQPWFARQPLTNAEGGMYAGDLGQGQGYGFAAWNFVWGDGEAHVDPHRYRLKLYRYEASSGKAVLFSNRVTRAKYDDPERALLEFGLHYENVEHKFKDFSC